MVKKIPGSLEYLIDLRGQIINSYGEVVEFKKASDNTVTINLFGETKRVSRRWLALLAWYEANHINDLQKHLDKIKFFATVANVLSLNCGRLMCFTEPIYFKQGFRYIPSFPRYAISIDGIVIDTFTNKLVTKKELQSGYEHIYIYNPDKNANRWTRIHRLLALAWIPNNDFINKPVVNHIDGNRSNNKLENLEWCSLSGNAQHALLIGLNKTPIKMKVRDVVTGEVVVFDSIAEMSRKLGTPMVSAESFTAKMPGYLYGKRYEIKVADDNSPWYFEDTEYDPETAGKSIYTITTFNKVTGETKKFSTLKAFYKEYKLWTKVTSLESGMAEFQEKYKDFDISCKRNAVSGPYRVLDLETNRITVVDSIVEVGECVGRTRTEIQYDLSRGLKFIYSNRWLIALGNDEIVIKDYKEKSNPSRKVLIVEDKTGKETAADSIKHAARISGINPKTIRANLNTGKITKGLSFRALDQ